MNTRWVRVERRDHVAVVRLERPEAMNAISDALADELRGDLEGVSQDRDVWAVVLSAAGERAFCVGADLKERAGYSLADYHDNRKQMRGMFAAVRHIPAPSIAAVFGHALGGGLELALSCDLIVASEDAQMGLTEARVGLVPAGGGTQLLARRVGLGRAREMIFTGRRVSARAGEQIGLVDRVVLPGEAEEAAIALALEVCTSSPVSLRAAKSALDAGPGMPLEQGIELEHAAWSVVVASEDRVEGIAAFNERRAPRWQNR